MLAKGTRRAVLSGRRLLTWAAVAMTLGVVLMVVGAAADLSGVIAAGLGLAVGGPSLAGIVAARRWARADADDASCPPKR